MINTTSQPKPELTEKMELDSEEGVRALVKGKFMEAEKVLKPLKEHNHLSSTRYALVQVMRFILTSDRSLLPEALDRVTLAESLCYKAKNIRKTAFEEFAGKSRSWKDAILMRSNFPNPYCEATSGKFSEPALDHLKMWRLTHGLHAFMTLFKAVLLVGTGSLKKMVQGGLALRSAWVQARNVSLEVVGGPEDSFKEGLSSKKSKNGLDTQVSTTVVGNDNNTATSEKCRDETGFCCLVKGIFLVLLENLPPHLKTLFSGIGFQFNRELGLQLLESTMKNQTFVEVRMFGSVITTLVHLLLSQREYNQNVKEEMEIANRVIQQSCKDDPGVILTEWVKSHVIRRQSRLKEAMAILDRLTPAVQNEVNLYNDAEKISMQNEPSENNIIVEVSDGNVSRKVNSYRLEFDRAMLHFVSFDFQNAIRYLEPLTATESSFNAKVLACMVLAACYAMDSSLSETVRIERYASALRSMETVNNDKRIHRMDKSILMKYEALTMRSEKDLIFFEALYIFGHMKAYSPLSGMGSVSWLQQRLQRLDAILETGKAFGSEVLEVPKPAEILDEDKSGYESLFVATLVKGAILNLLDKTEDAKSELQKIVNNQEYALKVFHDPYTVPWACYEIGVGLMRNGNEKDQQNAKTYFADARKFSKKRDYSFSHMLEYKCTGALQDLKDTKE